jgi:hypothetical protein
VRSGFAERGGGGDDVVRANRRRPFRKSRVEREACHGVNAASARTIQPGREQASPKHQSEAAAARASGYPRGNSR